MRKRRMKKNEENEEWNEEGRGKKNETVPGYLSRTSCLSIRALSTSGLSFSLIVGLPIKNLMRKKKEFF